MFVAGRDMINKHFNTIGSFISPTKNNPDTTYNCLKKTHRSNSCLLKEQGGVGAYSTENFISEQPDIRQILLLPDSLYKQAKDSWTVLLKKNHKKPILDRGLFNFITFPPARMRNFEQALFGKTLIPKERLSCYKIDIKSQQDVMAIQQVKAGVQGGAADDTISRFFAAGLLMMLVLDVLMVVAQKSKVFLGYNVSGFRVISDSDGVLQREISHVQVLIDWLGGARTAKIPNPSITELEDNLKDKQKAPFKSAKEDLCQDERLSVLCAATNFSSEGQGFFQGILKWLKGTDNGVSTDKSKEQTNIQIRMSDNQSADSSIQQLLKVIQDARSSLAAFGQ